MKALDAAALVMALVLTICVVIDVLYFAPHVTQALFGQPRVIICMPSADAFDGAMAP